jgi:FtsP/CotA-like multicopper oxidase with cupredoxin domain
MASTDDTIAPSQEPKTSDTANATPLAGEAPVAIVGETVPLPASSSPKMVTTSRWLTVDWTEAPLSGWQRAQRWLGVDLRSWGRRIVSPLGALAIVSLLTVALGGYALGAAGHGSSNYTSASSSSGMSMGSSSATSTNVPNATQDYGSQPARYVMDNDGAKHFTFTAKQVMWQPVKNLPRVLAWTLDGTVPGPTIRVTAGDHVRITIINHFPEATTLHWHGLEIPQIEDGVPGVGQSPIQPGQTFTYDFTVPLDNVGTYFYHSHYDDLIQVPGGFYGAFIVDPKPGTPEAQNVPHFDQEYTEIISELGPYFVINGKSFPDTQPINVVHGQTILVRLINLGEMIHPMHMHGHFFNVVAKDGAPLAQPMREDTVAIAPGESYDLSFYTWAAPGSVYPFHCHILAHTMNPSQSSDEMGGLIVLIKYAQ